MEIIGSLQSSNFNSYTLWVFITICQDLDKDLAKIYARSCYQELWKNHAWKWDKIYPRYMCGPCKIFTSLRHGTHKILTWLSYGAHKILTMINMQDSYMVKYIMHDSWLDLWVVYNARFLTGSWFIMHDSWLDLEWFIMHNSWLDLAWFIMHNSWLDLELFIMINMVWSWLDETKMMQVSYILL